MTPAAVVLMEELPLTRNGKVDRRALPKPEEAAGEVGVDGNYYRNAYEEMVSGIWKETLKVERVKKEDNFYEIGGHSLLAMQVVSRIRDVFGVEIGVRTVFEEPTLEGLARRVEDAMRTGEKSERPPLLRVSRAGRLPLSFAQQALWFIDQLEPDKSIYNSPGAVRLEGRLDLNALERCVNEIVRRHETLRTRIVVEEGQPVQVIDNWEYRRLAVEDLTSLTEEGRDEVVRRMIREEARARFDLAQGPLMRVRVLKLEEERHILLFTIHHIVSDAWSMGVLIREVGILYRAYHAGEESPLPELEIQYADYAKWQRQYLSNGALDEHLAYWKRHLSGKLSLLNLPMDHPRPPAPSYRGAAKSLLLSAELRQTLQALSRQEGTTMFMTLLASFKALLYRLTAQEDIIIGTAAANRNRGEVEPLIGYFVNVLPMRTDLSGNPRFSELLKRVKEVSLGAYAHQDMPFEKLIKEMQLERTIWEMPLYNVAFGLQNAPREDLRLNDIAIAPLDVEQEIARFDLAIWIRESSEGMDVSWLYSKDLFEEQTITRLHKHFETLLFSVTERPNARLTTLEISPEVENVMNNKHNGAWEALDIEEPAPIKRKVINLSTESA
jgi:acyl carrier protein